MFYNESETVYARCYHPIPKADQQPARPFQTYSFLEVEVVMIMNNHIRSSSSSQNNKLVRNF